MNKLYLFTTEDTPLGNYPYNNAIYCYSMAEDGVVIGNHTCSHIGFIRHDLVDHKSRHHELEDYFDCSIDELDIRIIPQGELPPFPIEQIKEAIDRYVKLKDFLHEMKKKK